MESNFIMEPTAPGAPFQNGLAERPNQTLGTMIRCLLHSANLGSEYWSFALIHATYLKNRLPHSAINDTPFHAYTGHKPSAKNLRVFGCPVIVKNPGKRLTKLDMNTSAGRFLGYTATSKNIYYMDSNTRHIKIATHCIFNEAGMTLSTNEQSPASIALQQAGYNFKEPHITPSPEPDNEIHPALQVKLLSDNAKLLTKASDGAAGFDVYSAINTTILPGQRALIPLDITITPPEGTYVQIASRSGLAVKHLLDTKAGVIDSDYTGNVTVVLHNSSPDTFHIHVGDRIAQMLIIPILNPTVTPTESISHTN